MRTFIYFTGTFETLTQVRQAYYLLAKQHHPDLGGDTETMKMINLEYEELSRLVISGSFYKDYSQWGRDRETSISAELMDIINLVVKLPLECCIVEICGNWIWINGNTKPIKDQIKAIGFHFSSGKVAWYWHPEGYRKKSGQSLDMDTIRSKYGSKSVDVQEKSTYIY